jgi:hypothetical protein
MAVRVGSAVFDDHISLEVWPKSWTDTFIFPVRHDAALPPWDYAEAVKTTIPVLRKMRRSPSLWVPVMAPGKWYFEEMRYALRNPTIPIAVTNGRQVPPRAIDFSVLPGVSGSPGGGGVPVQISAQLSEGAERCLLTMVRLVSAYTNEVATTSLSDRTSCLQALQELESKGYVEYHEHDPGIDSHIVRARGRPRTGEKKEKDIHPYWRIKRPGVSAALRLWGVPVGGKFACRSERIRLFDGPHRTKSRQWPSWAKEALPHSRIYAGWSEVGIPGLRATPDSLAWGEVNGIETLFWMEVESGKVSRQLILDKTRSRWQKAVSYANYMGLNLIFTFLGMPWVRNAARMAFTDVPDSCAVIIGDWTGGSFGKMPYPKWGEVVLEDES